MSKKNQDWKGNSISTYATLGSRGHALEDRAHRDYYATEPTAIDKLFELHKFDNQIWECACGEGHLTKAMQAHDKKVYSTDIENRGYENNVFDFLDSSIEWPGDIITNPPYKYAIEFVEKAIESVRDGAQVAMFLKLTFLESQSRRDFFEKFPPEYVYVFSKRMKCAKNGDFESAPSSAACYAWFVWRKGITSEPIIRWI